MRYGIVSRATYVLCDKHDEGINHLFFQYEFSSLIWEKVLEISNIRYGGQNWGRYVGEICIDWRWDKLKFWMGKISLRAIVYAIWKERNNRSFAKGNLTIERIMENVKRIMQAKGSELTKVYLTKNNVLIAKRWRLPLCIFRQNQQAHYPGW